MTTVVDCCPGEPAYGDPRGLHTLDCPVYQANCAAHERRQAQLRAEAEAARPPRTRTEADQLLAFMLNHVRNGGRARLRDLAEAIIAAGYRKIDT